jgi:hypothetical protein
MPLVTNVMTQPSGRVLSLPSHYGTYLRSSPVICALDALAFLLRIFVTPYLLPVSLRQALDITIRERYKDNEDVSEGIQSLEKQTWLRWLFFIVGTLGPSIKLMAMQGVLWTKAWGSMFLFAFFVSEAVVLFARRPTTVSPLPGTENDSARGVAGLQVAQRFKSVERWVFYAGSACHCAVLVWAFFDLWALRLPAYPDEKTHEPISMFLYLLLLFVGNIALVGPFILPLSLYDIFTTFRSEHRTQGHGRKWSERICISFAVGIMMVLIGFTCIPILVMDHRISMDSALFSLSVCSAPGFVFAVKKLCSLNPRLGETLMVALDEESPTVDGDAVNALTLCIANVTVSVLWYWLRYDPRGTVDPSWTEVFG